MVSESKVLQSFPLMSRVIREGDSVVEQLDSVLVEAHLEELTGPGDESRELSASVFVS